MFGVYQCCPYVMVRDPRSRPAHSPGCAIRALPEKGETLLKTMQSVYAATTSIRIFEIRGD